LKVSGRTRRQGQTSAGIPLNFDPGVGGGGSHTKTKFFPQICSRGWGKQKTTYHHAPNHFVAGEEEAEAPPKASSSIPQLCSRGRGEGQEPTKKS